MNDETREHPAISFEALARMSCDDEPIVELQMTTYGCQSRHHFTLLRSEALELIEELQEAEAQFIEEEVVGR